MKTQFNHLKLNSIIAGSGMTQNEIAERLHVHYNTVSGWVNSKPPRPDKLVSVLILTGMSDDDLKAQKLTDWYQVCQESES